jgi:transposase
MLGGPEWADVAPRMRRLLREMRTEWQALDRRIEAFDEEFAAKVRTGRVACRLATIPRIGVLNAMALVAAIGNGETFARGRDLPAWLGLVPRQAATGGKPRLLVISKQGNKYLRKLLIHGSRAAMPSLARSGTALGAWLRGLLARAHPKHATETPRFFPPAFRLPSTLTAGSPACCGWSMNCATEWKRSRAGDIGSRSGQN